MVILLVEDEAIVAMELEAVLTDAGHSVRGPASTTARALELAELERPDLALVNINLRDGHGSGIELARELLNRWGVASLFVSGQRNEAVKNRDAAVGFINKPYSPETILQAVDVVDEINKGGKPSPDMIPNRLELFPKDAP